MTLTSNLFGDGFPVLLDDRTATLGGAFYFDPIRPYSPLPLRWAYDQLIRYPSAVLLDVGASTGCYALLSAHHPDLTVHAFEPVPLTCEVLRENIKLNNLQSKVTVNQCGVGVSNGRDILHVVKSDGGKGVSMVGGKQAWHKDCDDIPVDVVTIDAYCDLHQIVPTMIKIDTEGSEELVLRGATETIEKYHPFLLFEYSQENADQFGLTASKTIEMIEAWGYVWSNPETTDIWAVPIGWEKIHDVQVIDDIQGD